MKPFIRAHCCLMNADLTKLKLRLDLVALLILFNVA